MKKLFYVLPLLFLSFNTFAQYTAQDLVNDFFDTYEKDPSKAVRNLYKTNKWNDRITDDIEQIISTIERFNESFVGKYHGYEVITTKRFSESFELYSYLVRYDRQPIRFIFKFYKPKDKWVLYAFSLDDSLDDEIEQAAKLYYLDLD